MSTDDKPAELDESNAKRRRYDRQLRLWGQHGQEAMEDSSICLINGSATGAETLKNLVLPGIGSFTIVDGAKVSTADLGNNFFLDSTSLGRPRAQCVTEMLQELNEHVAGSFVAEDITQVLSARPEFLLPFSLVIATQLPAAAQREVEAFCDAHKIPLIVVHTYGFLGYLKLNLGEHQVIESHPEHPFPDLRVLHPFPALRQLIDTSYADLTALSNAAFSHTPWVVLLIKAVDQWKAANGGALPTAYKQKKEVRAIVESYRRVGVQADQNIDEALSAVNTALNTPAPPSSVKALLGDARGQLSALVAENAAAASQLAGSDTAPSGAASGTAGSRKTQLAFWLKAAATERFVNGEGGGFLPLVGTLPDMTADTQTYVQLQQMYAQQAAADIAAVQAHVREVATAEGLPAEQLVGDDDLKLFCKNAHTLQRLSYASASGDVQSAPLLAGHLSSEDTPTQSCAALFLLLRASQAYAAERSHWPGDEGGAAGDPTDADVSVLKQCVAEAAKEMGLPSPSSGSGHVSDALCGEFCRWGGAEMHAIASVMGGIASQEAIKAATHQYVPLNNTFVYNGATGTTLTMTI